jgi:hypothetical protein
LERARSFANAVGLEIRDAVVQQKLAAADVVTMCYAESLGLPYVELEDVGVDENLAACVPPALARQHSCVPVMIDQGKLLMASPHPLVPDVEEELRLRFNMPVRTVLCTPASLNQAIGKHFPRDMVAAPVAQMRKPAATAAPAGAATTESASQPAPEPMSPQERRKYEVLVPATACMLTTFLGILVQTMFFKAPRNQLTFKSFVLEFGIGLVAAAIGYVVVRMKL